MYSAPLTWNQSIGWQSKAVEKENPDLVLYFGSREMLADGARDAAQQARDGLEGCRDNNGVAILISCIGRRLLMGQRALDEVEAAGAALGSKLRRLGFYSYGEISAHAVSGICELHNQTMTVTTISEEAA